MPALCSLYVRVSAWLCHWDWWLRRGRRVGGAVPWGLAGNWRRVGGAVPLGLAGKARGWRRAMGTGGQGVAWVALCLWDWRGREVSARRRVGGAVPRGLVGRHSVA